MFLEGLSTYFNWMTLTTSTGRPNEKTKYTHAIAELENALYVAKTNIPINEKEGNLSQAILERESANSFRAAIKQLKEEGKII